MRFHKPRRLCLNIKHHHIYARRYRLGCLRLRGERFSLRDAVMEWLGGETL